MRAYWKQLHLLFHRGNLYRPAEVTNWSKIEGRPMIVRERPREAQAEMPLIQKVARPQAVFYLIYFHLKFLLKDPH